jgi:hypothetical protein
LPLVVEPPVLLPPLLELPHADTVPAAKAAIASAANRLGTGFMSMLLLARRVPHGHSYFESPRGFYHQSTSRALLEETHGRGYATAITL